MNREEKENLFWGGMAFLTTIIIVVVSLVIFVKMIK